ncbi:serine protease filzig [Microplitis mediator]|uniref:serine protease filzig n=1 Tax=Microplitis mediator TaxID=375433 RepID=UPI002552B73A|nr:serine protease filzig [Microplitis mediator]
MMASLRYIYLLAYLTISITSISSDNDRGRKLFGGYRIEPKVCRPTNPSKIRSDEPALCMFNYECGQRNGQVVGACMDGFLFGACCQLPPSSISSSLLSTISASTKRPINQETKTTIKTIETITRKPAETTNYFEPNYSTLINQQSIIDDLSQPDLLGNSDSNNDLQNKETSAEYTELKPVATLTRPDQVLQIADPVYQLPSLFSHGLPSNNNSHLETILLDKNGTAIDNKIGDFSFKPTNRSTLSPYSSSAGTTKKLSSSTESTTRMRPTHYMNTQKISESTTDSNLVRVSTISHNTMSGNKKHDDTVDFQKEEIAINHIISMLNASTPSGSSGTSPYDIQKLHSSSSSVHGWVTIDDTSESTNTETFPYTFFKPVQSTKPANFYHYEVASSTPIISNTKSKPTRPPNIILSSDFNHNNYNYPSTQSLSSSYHYLSTKPTTLPPAPTVIVLGPLGTNDFTSVTSPKPFTRRPVNQQQQQQQNKPIYSSSSTSYFHSSAKPSSSKPSIKPTIKPSQTNKPGTTITHNISTIISTDSNADTSSSSNIISTSFINVKLKDTSSPKPSAGNDATVVTKKPTTVWTTLSTWSSKPSFQLRPGQPDFEWPQDNLTPVHTIVFKPTIKPLSENIVTTPESDDNEGTTTNDHLINFPPDRNPNLTNSTPTSQQEKPTIVESSNNTNYPEIEIQNENEIQTPGFIEDDILTNKVDDFVHKIVDSLQGNFQDLKDIVYNRKNITTQTTVPPYVITKKPPTKRPTQQKTTTKKPPTKRPVKPPTNSATSAKPIKVTKPDKITTSTVSGVGSTTKRPIVTTKRPFKPTKKVNVTSTIGSSTSSTTQKLEFHSTEASVVETTQFSTTPDFRKECGVRPMIRGGRVVGGRNATFGEWPWQVLVREATWLGLFTKNKCGGVLITDKYVITAAHCQPGFLASLVAVFGEYDISGELEQRRSVSRNVRRVIVHREYDAASFANDLAILELEKPVEFDAHIVPICMPDDNTDYVGRMATVTGWGRVKYNGGVPSILQEVQVPIMENSVCQEMFRTAGHSKLILDSFLCAGYANGQKDSCEGDSGGPLMMEKPDGRWFLVGTVSHGIKCAAPYLPGVYMRTTYFKPWLHSVTGV